MRKQEKTGRAIPGLLLIVTATATFLLMNTATVATTLVATTSIQLMGKGDFTLPVVTSKGLTDRNLTLSNFRGNATVLWFMVPWCPHCQRAAPVIEKLYRQYAEKGVVFIAIAGPFRGASPASVARFIRDYNSSLTYVYDSTGDTFGMYGIRGTPTFFILFENGEISNSYSGETSYDTLAKAIAFAAGLSEIATTCYLLTQPVTIDGKWTSKSEWTDAQEVQLLAGEGAGVGYFRVKCDDRWLYVMAESLVDASVTYNSAKNSGDYFSVLLDTLGNDGRSPLTDDYWFYAEWKDASHMELITRNGNGTYWRETDPIDGVEAEIGLDTGNSPHAPQHTPHVAGEFRIPLSIIGIGTFRFFVRFGDSSQALSMHLYWPGPTTVDQAMDPSSWGNVSISNIPIPEFSSTWLIIVASTLTVMVMFRLKKNMKLSDR